MLVACSGQSEPVGENQGSAEGDEIATEENEIPADSDSPFPRPKDFSNLISDDASVNFQTKASIDEMVSYYRNEFSEMGLTERELLTAIEDSTVSMVFDGHASGQAIVLQMVDLGESTNINIRFKDV